MRTPPKPTVYSQKLTKRENAALARFEALTGHWPVALEELEAGKLTAAELWRQQIAWVDCVRAELASMKF